MVALTREMRKLTSLVCIEGVLCVICFQEDGLVCGCGKLSYGLGGCFVDRIPGLWFFMWPCCVSLDSGKYLCTFFTEMSGHVL